MAHLALVTIVVPDYDDAIAYYKAHAGKKKQITLTSRLAFQLADDLLAWCGSHPS